MSDKKEKLYKYLKKRNYFELEEKVSAAAKSARSTTKQLSERQKKKKFVDAVKRFQTFSDLPATGRVNKATMQEIEKPRCGNPDLTLAESVTLEAMPPRWNTKNITYGFRNVTQQIQPPQVVKNAIATAFGIWRQAVPTFSFREVSLAEGPMIKFLFIAGPHGDGENFAGGDGVVGHAFPPNSPTLRGEVHFDNAEQWGVDGSATKIDLITVAIHEIGHALGLVEHSTNSNAQMFAKYTRVFRGLHPEDVARIQNLYP